MPVAEPEKQDEPSIMELNEEKKQVRQGFFFLSFFLSSFFFLLSLFCFFLQRSCVVKFIKIETVLTSTKLSET